MLSYLANDDMGITHVIFAQSNVVNEGLNCVTDVYAFEAEWDEETESYLMDFNVYMEDWGTTLEWHAEVTLPFGDHSLRLICDVAAGLAMDYLKSQGEQR